VRWGECLAKRGMCPRLEGPRKVAISDGSGIAAWSAGTTLNDVCVSECVYVCVKECVYVCERACVPVCTHTYSLARSLARSLSLALSLSHRSSLSSFGE
jgi:hypothetical protein